MTIQIEIINAKVSTGTGKGNKTYQFLDLAYKNLTFQGKVEGRKIMSFGATEATFKELATAQGGQVFDIEIVKNAATGYNDWVGAKKSDGTGGTATKTPTAGGATAPNTSSTATRSTYETPEERAKKQIFIIRQSSLSTATDIVTVGAKKVDVKEVIDVARQLEAYVLNGQVDVAKSFDDLETAVE